LEVLFLFFGETKNYRKLVEVDCSRSKYFS
jgi:hypothetical protein